jgi:Rod binding domain-containing protein
MNVTPLQSRIVASDIAPEQLAGNQSLTEEQKIGEASRQFEAVLLRQILSDSQKTVIPSEFSDNSTAAGIYHDLISNTLADNISKSGKFGLARIFEHQLSRPASHPLLKMDATGSVSGK